MCWTKLSCLFEVVAQKSSRSTMSFSGGLAVLADDHRARLRRIGIKHHVETFPVGRQRVGDHDGMYLSADSVQQKIHRAHARSSLH